MNEKWKENNIFRPMVYPELEKAKHSFFRMNQETILDIVRRNSDTEYGRKYHFSEVQTLSDYDRLVPVCKYADLQEYMDRIMSGEKDILFTGNLYAFAETSGSTQKRKHIPESEEAMKQYGNIVDRFPAAFARDHQGKRFFLSFLQSDLSLPHQETDSSVFSSIYYRYLADHGLMDLTTWVGEGPLNFFPEPCDYLYAKLWLAFASEDIITMETIFLYDYLLFFHYMESHFREVLKDMEQGRPSEQVDLPESVREALSRLPVSKARLDHIREVCADGFKGIVPRLWPNVQMIGGIVSNAFKVEELSFQRYIGKDPIPLWAYIYAASECLSAVPYNFDSYDYIFYPNMGGYEFRSVSDQKIYPPEELRIGEMYELILTSHAGLYRYSMGDILRIVGFYGQLPIFRFLFRKNLVLNIAGEKLDIETLDRAVRHWSEEQGVRIWQYFFYEDRSVVPSRYSGILAPDTGQSVPGTPPAGINDSSTGYGYRGMRGDEMLRYDAAALDRCLQRLSEDYRELRQLGSIDMPVIRYMEKDAFLRYKEELSLSTGQAKPQHIWRAEANENKEY